jgi:hypothetical protein
MSYELMIVERAKASGIVADLNQPPLRYDFEIMGSPEPVNIARSISGKDFEITLHPESISSVGGDTSVILCTFNNDLDTASRSEYLLNLEIRLKDEFAQRSMAVNVYLSPELLKRYG